MLHLMRHNKAFRLLICLWLHNSSDSPGPQQPYIRHTQTGSRRSQYFYRSGKRNGRKSHHTENKVVPPRAYLGLVRTMALSKQQHPPLPGNPISRSTNWNTSPVTNLNNYRSVDITRRNLSRVNHIPSPNNYNMGWLCQIRPYKENQCMVILSD